VTRPGGTGLLLVEVDHEATPTEPQYLERDLLDRFTGWSTVFAELAALRSDHNLYQSWRERQPAPATGPALLGARLERRSAPYALNHDSA
jgi:hypothetical protein